MLFKEEGEGQTHIKKIMLQAFWQYKIKGKIVTHLGLNGHNLKKGHFPTDLCTILLHFVATDLMHFFNSPLEMIVQNAIKTDDLSGGASLHIRASL